MLAVDSEVSVRCGIRGLTRFIAQFIGMNFQALEQHGAPRGQCCSSPHQGGQMASRNAERTALVCQGRPGTACGLLPVYEGLCSPASVQMMLGRTTLKKYALTNVTSSSFVVDSTCHSFVSTLPATPPLSSSLQHCLLCPCLSV